ncbi:MAG: hypothetical protein MUF18_10690 [Fimbriiglobus sp.]|nr:hypothetical protein [Fimbriiglobus sp.]
MDRHANSPARGLALVATVVLLLVPPAVLGMAALQRGSALLAIGAIGQALGSALLVRSRYAWRPPASGIVICLYLIALGWLWFATQDSPDSFARFGRGLFLVAAVGLLVCHDFIRTGVEPRRRAKKWTTALLTRAHWPRTADEVAHLPEVRALYTAVRDDPTLAFPLLDDPRPEVQLAALFALRDRETWRWDATAVVVESAKKAVTSEVRAATLRAVATADTAAIAKLIGESLRDPSPEVRAAATEALLTGGDARWAFLRNAVRAALSDVHLAADGPLPASAGRLPASALCDLFTWAGEPGTLAERAVRTLVTHYHAILSAGTHPGLAAELGRQVTDAESPAVLRLELALLLRNLQLIPPALQDRMTDPDQPSPVRLIAVEVMLAADPEDVTALDVLRGLGRQQNRETGLAIARVLQKYCGVAFGLPATNASVKQQTDAVQRVYRWATSKLTGGPVDTPLPGRGDDEDALGGLPPSAYPASAPGLTPPKFKNRR